MLELCSQKQAISMPLRERVREKAAVTGGERSYVLGRWSFGTIWGYKTRIGLCSPSQRIWIRKVQWQ